MQHVRRLAPIVGVVLLGGVVLAGCRSQPDVAAYVGTDRITEAQVDDLLDQIAAKQAPATPAASPGVEAPQAPRVSRTEVVTTLVLQRVCEQLKAKGLTPTPITPAQIEQAEGVPADTAYAQARASVWSCVLGAQGAEGFKPTDEELLALYNKAVAEGAFDPAQAPFDAVKGELASNQQVLAALAKNRVLTEAAAAADVTVNPRYRPLEFPVFGLQNGATLISVTVGEAALNAVTPAPSAAAATPDGAEAPPQ
ncbi:hypothetical protein [Luedemannella helvata]